jgi:hypothetical protein
MPVRFWDTDTWDYRTWDLSGGAMPADNLRTIRNTRSVTVQTDKKVNGQTVTFTLAPSEAIDVFDSEIGPTMSIQIDSGILAIEQTIPATTHGTATGGSTTTVVDTARTEDSDFWNGLTLTMMTGASAGVSATIADWELTTTTFTFNTSLPFPAGVSSGDEYMITGHTPPSVSIGVTPDQKDALNGAHTPNTDNPLATMADLELAGITPYVVGKDAGDPYDSIQDAIDAAWNASPTHSNPLSIIVKPGVYVEDIVMKPHLIIEAWDGGKHYMTKVTGKMSFENTESGTVGDQISSWFGIDISQSSADATLTFTGTNPQQLRISNCEVNNSGSGAAIKLENTGSGSMVVYDNVNFNNLGTGYAVDLLRGKLAGQNGQTNAATTADTSVHVTNNAEVEFIAHYARGKMHFESTGNGSIRGTTFIDAGAGASDAVITMDSTGQLIIAGVYTQPTVTTPVDGANPANVISLSAI